jgi:hypothetical protein
MRLPLAACMRAPGCPGLPADVSCHAAAAACVLPAQDVAAPHLPAVRLAGLHRSAAAVSTKPAAAKLKKAGHRRVHRTVVAARDMMYKAVEAVPPEALEQAPHLFSGELQLERPAGVMVTAIYPSGKIDAYSKGFISPAFTEAQAKEALRALTSLAPVKEGTALRQVTLHMPVVDGATGGGEASGGDEEEEVRVEDADGAAGEEWWEEEEAGGGTRMMMEEEGEEEGGGGTQQHMMEEEEEEEEEAVEAA